MEHFPNCDGQRRIIAAPLEASVIGRLLTHLSQGSGCGIQATQRYDK